MNLQQLYYLKTISETANYTKAAERLFIAQSSLSHSISDLEKELGVPLFYKKGRLMILTEFGEILLSHATRAIDELESARREISLAKDATAGTIKVMLTPTIANRFSDILKGFYDAEPNNSTVLEVRGGTRQDVLEALRDHVVDIGFSAHSATSDTEAFPLEYAEMVVIVPRDHPWADRDNIAISDLDGIPLVLHSQRCGTRKYANSIMKKAGVKLVVAREGETEQIIAGLVAAGKDIGLVPNEPELKSFDVHVIPLEHGRYRRIIYMMWLNEKELLPYVRNFRDYVIQHYRDRVTDN